MSTWSARIPLVAGDPNPYASTYSYILVKFDSLIVARLSSRTLWQHGHPEGG